MTAIDTSTAGPTLSVADPLIDPEAAAMVAVPTPAPVADPLELIAATVGNDELQVTLPLRSCVLPLLYVPVAVNCWLLPAAMEAADGVTEIEVNTAGVTDNDAEPLMVPEVAMTRAAPGARLVASPPLFTVAMEAADDVQAAVVVRFCVVPLL